MDNKRQQEIAPKDLAPLAGELVLVTEANIKALEEHRKLMHGFVHGQLKEALFTEEARDVGNYGEGDYGIIPGTKKRSLFKPGAEKLLRLFNLGFRLKQTDKEFDRHANFALYSYKAEIYSLRTGIVVAECEGNANSQEEKFKYVTVWKKAFKNDKEVWESEKVEREVSDVNNTVMKMAQKRAIVGGVLLATGASEYFTHDMIEQEDFEIAARDVTPGKERRMAANKKKEKPKKVDPHFAPMCCGRKMIVSKIFDRQMACIPFYCTKCQKKIDPKQGAA